MFQDLDTTLQAILDDPAAPALLSNADVSFETPDRNYRPAQATVNLFLYEVKENRELRDQEPVFDLVNGQYVRRQPPLRVSCSYLVTTWSNQTGANKAAEEHRLLGLAMAWLSRLDTIPTNYLRGTLVGQPYLLPVLVAQTDGKQSLGEFWNALGTAPRPAFVLEVMAVLDLELTEELGPEVTTHKLQLEKDGSSKEISYTAAGTVRTSDSQAGIAGAHISIIELARTTQTDADGHFQFTGLAQGSYTIEASAGGFQTMTVIFMVPGTTPHAYDLALPAQPVANAQGSVPQRRPRGRSKNPKAGGSKP
jgi:hypothetical protein